MISARDLMNTTLHSAIPEDSLLSAYRQMHSKEIRHLPVFKDGKLVGMLSDRDIGKAMSIKDPGKGRDSMVLDEKLVIRDFMSSPVHSVTAGASVDQIIQKMVNHKISAVMVTDGEGKSVGIITSQDLLLRLWKLVNQQEELKNRPLSTLFQNTLY